jgi:hypothetical protein
MERRKILIATKTYPSISKKYKETVCTAGILLDEDETPVCWIRIYPVRFRTLSFDKQYPRWSIISAKIERNEKDYRVESYRIDDSSIEIIRALSTSNYWQERKSFVLPFQSQSISAIRRAGSSLGIIKPLKIDSYFCRSAPGEWSDSQKAVLDQGDFFEESSDLEKIPYQFGYKFIAQDGSQHKFSISDWEISQLYRNCRNSSQKATLAEREREALEKVRQKLEDKFMDEDKVDLHFIVGNLKNHSKTFMIIGLFYPPFTSQLELGI